MSLGMKARLYGLAIFAVVVGTLAASIAWPSTGTSNVAALVMFALIAYYAISVVVLSAYLSDLKGDDADKRKRAVEVLGQQTEARDKRSVYGRTWSVIEMVTMAVLSAYVGMLFGALLFAFLSMIVRLQYVGAGELLKQSKTGAGSPA